MRVLAYLAPARGHLFPMIPVLQALQGRGHEVAVRTLAAETGRLQDMGFVAAAVDPAIEERAFEDFTARGTRAKIRSSLETMGSRAPLEVDDLRGAIEGERPDVLVVDVNSWGAQAVAEASRLPWALAMHFPVWLSGGPAPPFGPGLRPARGPLGRARDAALRPVLLGTFWREMRPRLNEVRRRVGVPEAVGLDDVFLRPPLVLSFTAEPFEYPRAWPPGFRLIGPCPWEPPSDPPAWLAEDERPLVLVSTSTEYQGDEALVRTAFAALADRTDLRVVATLPSADRGDIEIPANARIERFCPHGPLLARAALVICHGGMGITQKAIAAGVPVCVVPFGRDQLEVARRAEVCGAGTRLPASRLRVDRLRGAAEAAMACRPRTREVAAAFADAGGGPAGADALAALARAPAVAASGA